MLFSAVKSDTEPDTLANLSLECICKNLTDVFKLDENGYSVESDTVLPKVIWESLIVMYQRTLRSVDDKFVNLFSDKRQSALQRITIWNSSITDKGLKKILQNNLRELDLAYCKNVTSASLDVINDNGKNLRSLSLGSDVDIVPEIPVLELKVAKFSERGYVFNTPNLVRLILKDVRQPPEAKFYDTLLSALPLLTYLDLSCCAEIGDLSYLSHCPNLTSLTLFNCANLQNAIPNICLSTKLRHLDISTSEESQGTYSRENILLKKIVASLPDLISLDISGTNLAGQGNVEKELFYETQDYQSDIPGLADRAKKPLEFLGLYGTQHRACKRHDIPALKISGDANEDQILTAGTVYMNRPQMLQRVMNDYFHFLREGRCINISKLLMIILEGLNTHAQEIHIQISGSAALFYIVRSKTPNLGNQSIKTSVISTVLNSMTLHMHDETMLRNGCLTLCQFRIPQDILSVYHKLVKLLLHIIMDNEDFVQRIGIYLMNSLACQVNDTQKEILGNLGIIEKMLTLISKRIEEGQCDDVLEVAWSTMWNVTDETPINCQRFLDNGGMTRFIYCLEQFRHKNELMRNMMGLLGNVAEVEELRLGLMPYIRIFYDLVDSMQDGIEVSYNAAGVISHIASDGPAAWEVSEVSREAVLTKMVNAIDRWDLKSERNINYRSFEPILKLTRVRHTPQCQHWAIWALANLTEVYPEKYCPILEAENGLKDMHALINADEKTYDKIKQLARRVLYNYDRYYKVVKAQNQLKNADAMHVVDEAVE